MPNEVHYISFEVIFEMVRERGLEPPQPFGHRLLRPACLPIPPSARMKPYIQKSKNFLSPDAAFQVSLSLAL